MGNGKGSEGGLGEGSNEGTIVEPGGGTREGVCVGTGVGVGKEVGRGDGLLDGTARQPGGSLNIPDPDRAF